jgi:hypothetical protein
VRGFALLLLALPLSACGGSSNAVAKAATKASNSGSEHVQFTGHVTSAGQTIRMTGAGDFQNQPKLGQMQFAMDVAGKHVAMTEVIRDATIYLKSSLFAPALAASGKEWMSVDLKKADLRGANLNAYTQGSPTDTLKALEQAGSVKKIGDEKVAGEQTTHYQAVIDYSKIPNGAKLQQLANVKTAPIDVWIGSGNLLRRMKLSMTTTTKGQTVGTSMVLDLTKYGEPVNVQVPPAKKTMDVTTSLGG